MGKVLLERVPVYRNGKRFSKFVTDASDEYWAIVDQLACGRSVHLDQVYGEIMQHRARRRFIEQYQARPSKHEDLRCFRLKALHEEWNPQLPSADHTSVWKNDAGYIYVTQPYGVTMEMLLAQLAFCQFHGLSMELDHQLSWWYPSSTVAIIVTRKCDRDGHERVRREAYEKAKNKRVDDEEMTSRGKGSRDQGIKGTREEKAI